MLEQNIEVSVRKEDIISAIRHTTESPYKTPRTDQLNESAVLLVFHQHESNWQLLFTKRSDSLSSHPGQISFPGGRPEDCDLNLVDTAIRETFEEVGIAPDLIEIEAELSPVTTLTGYRIKPFICFIDELPELNLDPVEVDVAFSIPLDFLSNTENLATIEKNIHGISFTTFVLDWDKHRIWGATANMVADLVYRLERFNLSQLEC